MKRLLRALVVVVVVLLVLAPFAAIRAGRHQLHDAGIERRDALLDAAPRRRVMTFFPHPDDEVSVAGTLASLVAQGHEVHLVCLTRGEKGASGDITDPVELARVRTREMEAATRVIGAHELHFLDYADGGLEALGLDSLQAIAARLVREIRPDVVITYDSNVGMYGHPDHRIAGRAMEQLYRASAGQPGFTPERLYQVTLSPKQIAVARRISPIFRKRYPTAPGAGLPVPDFSVHTQPYFTQIRGVLAAHASQRWVLGQFFPFHDRVPAPIYSRIFDREYFREVPR
jgi:LmbE family N-acetylglucosaminyl deacetylase